MELSPTIKAVQRKLGVPDDGIAGRATWAAIAKVLGIEPAPTLTPAGFFNGIDERSEQTISSLRQPVQPLARRLIQLLKEDGLTFKVTSGFRSYEEQDELYEQGRSKPGKIVTNARGGYSNHNFALAFDITQFDGNRPIYESDDYKTAGKLGKSIGLLWGGDWSNGDEPHFEFRPGWAINMTENQALAEYRERKANGKEIA